MVEEAIIQRCGRVDIDGDTASLLNKRHEISPSPEFYDAALAWGNDWFVANLGSVVC